MTGPIRVLVVDDQPMVRMGLRMMLDAEADIEVVDEARDGIDAVEKAEQHGPDVVLMDIRMPRLDGVEATRRIVAAGTARAVVVITTFDDEEYLLGSVRAGASGFLLKDAGADLLAAAVRTALRGDTLIDPAMTRSLLEHRLGAESRAVDAVVPADQAALLATLTDREREVLEAIARGLSNAAIASEFFLSAATVKTHISAVLQKTKTASRVQAAVFAYEVGFVRPGWLGG
ncbi:DNA-binding NarL/FixJ family response regulator [Conyzicola lurida]|uniref:DNA-binding NarL/FixJ family response regulator n=1 Tax=Conyzicola lurida TaxID=1172621 RepID=A0A841ANW7_9MICO|nr:DNA-binding NarL/FixJ family response regulator [Conyzicola lurida]